MLEREREKSKNDNARKSPDILRIDRRFDPATRRTATWCIVRSIRFPIKILQNRSPESLRNNPVVQRSLLQRRVSLARLSRIRQSDQYSRAIRPNNPGWLVSLVISENLSRRRMMRGYRDNRQARRPDFELD